MEIHNLAYVGNLVKIAEMISYNENFSLSYIICERDKLNDEIFTFSLVRKIELILVSTKEELKNVIDNIKNEVDLCLMCSFGIRIPIDCLEKLRFFNIHYGWLPDYKGRHVTYWATVNNEKYIGVSLHLVTEGIDEGSIINQKKVPYYIWEKENDIFEKLTNQVPILLSSLLKYLSGNCAALQNIAGVYYPPVQEKEKIINLEEDSYDYIYNVVRAESKYDGTKIYKNKNCYLIRNANFTYKEDCEIEEAIIDDKLIIHIRNNVFLISTEFSIV